MRKSDSASNGVRASLSSLASSHASASESGKLLATHEIRLEASNLRVHSSLDRTNLACVIGGPMIELGLSRKLLTYLFEISRNGILIYLRTKFSKIVTSDLSAQAIQAPKRLDRAPGSLPRL